MDGRSPDPWKPDRTWADPFLATLALIIVLVVGLSSRSARRSAPAPPDHVDLQGRLADLALAAPKVLNGAQAGSIQGLLGRDVGSLELEGWNRAVLAVHAAEDGDVAKGRALAAAVPGRGGEAFRAALAWAYEGQGPAPGPEALRLAQKGLGDGYAARALEAATAGRQGADPAPARARAAAWALPRIAALAAGGLAAFGCFLGGLGFMAYLSLSRAPRPVLPRYEQSGRSLLIVLLGWFLTHLGASFVLGLLLALLPFLRPLGLPLAYLFHATLGTWYLCRAEGVRAGDLARRLAPGGHGRALAQGAGFLALAFTCVVAVTVALAPILKHVQPPQHDLMEILARARGPFALACLFLTVAVVAPVFEELLFRGFLLPWLGERLEPRLGRRAGWSLAVLVTGLAFGAMHLEPAGLPTLCTLGVVLGFAYLRTGNLLTSILLHGLWNGGIFLFMRTLA